MATKNDIISAQTKWGQRIRAARAAGLPDSSWQNLMQQDLTGIREQGKTPMADKEVNDAMLASAGRSPIKDPSAGHGGIMDVVGNIASDVRGIVTGWPSGVASYVTSLPEQVADYAKILSGDQATMDKYNLSPVHDIGDFLRDLPNVPVVGPLIPGAHTAAAATTAEGRKSLEEHPVSTTIDVGSAIATGGNLGAFGRAGEAAAEGADAATAAEAKPPTALQALQEGHPYKAVGRTALTAIEKTPVLRDKMSRRQLSQMADDLTISPKMTNLARTRGEQQSAASIEAEDWARQHLAPWKDLTDEEKASFSRIAQGVGTAEDHAWFNAHPEMQQLLSDAKRWREEMATQNPHEANIRTSWGRSYIYQKGSAVEKAFSRTKHLEAQSKKAEKARDDLYKLANEAIVKYGPNDRLTHRAVDRAKEAQAAFDKADKKYGEALAKHNQTLSKNAPAAFYPVLAEQARQTGITAVEHNTKITQAQIHEAVTSIQNSINFEEFARALSSGGVGRKQATQIWKETEASWMELAREGADPILLPNVGGSKITKIHAPSVIPEARYAKSSKAKEQAFNLSHTVQDVAMGLAEEKRLQLNEAGTRQWVNDAIKPLAQPEYKVGQDIEKAILNGRGVHTAEDIRIAKADEIKRHWVPFDPERYGLGQYFPHAEGQSILIPKGVARSLKYLGYSDREHPLMNTFDKGMGVWRFAVLATPRHISHVLFGGMVMGALQDPLFLLDARNAVRLIKAHDPEIFRKFGKNVNDFTVDQFVSYSSGKSLGRILTAATGGVHWVQRMEDNATLMYKTSYMLRKERTGIGREEAIREANKVFVSANEMSPIERGVFRKVFPFWGFTRHLFRYLMTYPVDHPLRAAILTNLANQHYADWNSGLPQQLSFMFFLGQPDKNGNVSAVDYRSIDPFRSFYNDFTLAGLFADSNPAVQFAMQQAGVNVLSATPELYPGKHYDPSTGTMVADRPSNPMLDAFEAFIPESQAVDALMQVSDQYRNLKVSDPDAYKARVFSALGIPYAGNVNIPRKVESAQMKRYTDAQTSIASALRTGDFSKAKRYSSVPIPSQLQRYFGHLSYATPGDIERIYNALISQANAKGQGGVNLHALLPRG